MRRKSGDLRELYGLLKYHGAPLTIEQMDEAVGEAVVDELKRSVPCNRLAALRTIKAHWRSSGRQKPTR